MTRQAKTRAGDVIGSYRYMAPEVFRHEPYSEKCDVYSFGLLTFSLLQRGLMHPLKAVG